MFECLSRSVSRVSRGRARLFSRTSRSGFAWIATRQNPAPDGRQTTVYLLLQLRKANRTIIRLRACARAARGGNEEELRAALAALRSSDLEP